MPIRIPCSIFHQTGAERLKDGWNGILSEFNGQLFRPEIGLEFPPFSAKFPL
jgi:hypothetical protein